MSWELPLLVWFIEVFTPASYVMSTGAFIKLTLVIGIPIAIMFALASIDYNEKDKLSPIIRFWNFVKEKVWKPWLYTLMGVMALNFFGNLMPGKEAAYKIAAAYGVQSAYEAATGSEDVKRMAGKSLEVLETSMDRYLSGGVAAATETKEVVVKKVQEVVQETPEVVVETTTEASTEEKTEPTPSIDLTKPLVSDEMKEKAALAAEDVGNLLIDKLAETAKEELQK